MTQVADLRVGSLHVLGTPGTTRTVVLTWLVDGDPFPLDGMAVSLWTGGGAEPTDLTDATEHPAVVDANTATVNLPILRREKLTLTLDGEVVATGQISISHRGTTTPTHEVTVLLGEVHVTVDLGGDAAVTALASRLAALEAIAVVDTPEEEP